MSRVILVTQQARGYGEFRKPVVRALYRRYERRCLERALHELPPRCREAFALSRHEGWSTEQIATGLGVSDRMVRLYLVRTLEHLRTALSSGSEIGARR